MTDARVVMDNFMEKLNTDKYIRENQPNNGPDINTDFIEKQLAAYTTLLESGILEQALDEQR